MKKAFYKAFPYTIPILTGYLFMGIAFGILLNKAGYNFIWAFFMALFMFAGSMQFVAVELLKQPFNLINVAIMSLLVNARHLFYGISMFDKFDKTGKLKPYMIHALTDESYSRISLKIPKTRNALKSCLQLCDISPQTTPKMICDGIRLSLKGSKSCV